MPKSTTIKITGWSLTVEELKNFVDDLNNLGALNTDTVSYSVDDTGYQLDPGNGLTLSYTKRYQ